LLDKLRDIHFFGKGVFRMKRKPVQCMVLCLVVALPCVAFAYQENLKVRVSVRGGCATTGNDEVNFGEHLAGQGGTYSAVGVVHYWCSSGVTHTIDINNGENYSGSMRRMKRAGGPEFISYHVDWIPKSGIGAGPTPLARVDVTATIPTGGLSNAPPGEYEDTLIVTVEP
jgi:spore coat protein U-like protein